MVHLRLDGQKMACGGERNAWPSMWLTSTSHTCMVNCGNCIRTKAYKDAVAANDR